MTGLDIHSVKSGLARKKRALAEFFLQRLEIVVRHDAAVVCRAVLLQFRMAVGNDRSRLVVRVGIPAAMVGLHDQIRYEAVHLKARFLDGLRQTLVAVKILAAQIKLRRGGTPLRDNGDRLKPDDRTAAFRFTQVAARSKIRRRAVRQGVRALHRRDTEPVRENMLAYAQRLGQSMRIRRKRQRYAERGSGLFYFVQCFVVKFLVHNQPHSLLMWNPPSTSR